MWNIFKKDDDEFDETLLANPLNPDCDPSRESDWCHFENITYDGAGIKKMKAAHTYFYLINIINFIAPAGYWAMWALIKIDPVNNILPIVDEVMDFITLITDFTTLVGGASTGDYDGDGDEDADDLTYLEGELAAFETALTDLFDLFDVVIQLFTWPIAAACVVASFNAIASYWVIARYKKTVKAPTKTMRVGAWMSHVKVFFWQNFIIGAGITALAFLDTTDLGSGEFDMTTNGLIFIVMGGVYGFTTIFNLINYKTERKWFKMIRAYAAVNHYADDEDFDQYGKLNGKDADEVAEIEDEDTLFDDNEWSW